MKQTLVNINQHDVEINIHKCLLSSLYIERIIYCFSIISGGEFQELQYSRVLNMETDGRNCSFARYMLNGVYENLREGDTSDKF